MSRAAVRIVGAGAGDASCLTLGALDSLRRADVVFADDLVDSSILELIPPRAALRRVGKRGGRPSADQDDINAQLIAAARAGHNVVRLKGGDPFIFGRGGEEAAALHNAGIPVAVQPGLTAALVAAASAGIPLTDRRAATQVSFITAATAQDATPDLTGLVGPGKTLVVYMGVGKAAQIARQLLASPLSAQLPIALIEDGGRPGQIVTLSTPERLTTDAARRDPDKPALLIIGEVVNLAVRHG